MDGFYFDFALVLVGLTVITGVIAIYDWTIGRRRRLAANDGKETQDPVIVEYSKSLFPIILVVTILRSFLIEPFRIPSGSMMPTLLVGDFILVNKYAYGIRMPVTNTKLMDVGAPKRGDVIVFRNPEAPHKDYIKRVIGVPGDTVKYRNKVLYVNNKQAKQQWLDNYRDPANRVPPGTRRMAEDLVGVKHEILISRRKTDNDDFIREIPDNHYWVMGDNRDNSRDSRKIESIHEKYLVGRAFMIWMHLGDEGFNFDRIGEPIK